MTPHALFMISDLYDTLPLMVGIYVFLFHISRGEEESDMTAANHLGRVVMVSSGKTGSGSKGGLAVYII